MCGIVGVVQSGRPVDRGVFARMTSALAHRGPDRQDVQHLGTGGVHVGLGHTRLSVLDLSDAAAQPMRNEDGSVWLVFNGEIYNFASLRQELAQRGVRFRTTSDTEVILRLYEAEGARCVERLDGMFAFAIWDARRERLVLARDRVGKKPLFYAAWPGGFAFASEIKALLRHPEIPGDVDRQTLPAFFLYGYVPSPRTIYRGIQQLQPAHVLELAPNGHIRIERYWDLLAARAPGPAPTPEEAAVRVRELVTDAVQRRLVADVPLGAFLSGGIDSSVIVGLMSRLRREPVRTFSIGFAGDARYNETAYARAAANHFGTLHTEFVVEPSAVKLIEQLVWHHDGPFADESAIPTYLLAQLTRQHVTVALNGDGGDELFGGYHRFRGTLLADRIPLTLRRAARWCARGLPKAGVYRSATRKARTFAEGAAFPFAQRFSRWASIFYDDLPALLPDAWAAEPLPQPLAVVDECIGRCNGASPLTKLLYVNFHTYLLDDLLVKMDRCTMAHGLEARAPLLDRALIEYVFSLPDEMKLAGGQTKAIFRRAFADVLPQQILRRSKMGFTPPLRAWFDGELRDYVQETLLTPDARLRGYVDQDHVRRLWQEQAAGRADHASRLWTLLTFEVWLRNLPSWRYLESHTERCGS